MQNDVIKLPDKEAMHLHYFCPECHFWLINEQFTGCNYCPNCGIKLNWDNTTIKGTIFKAMLKFSSERYKQLKEVKNAE